MITTIVQDITPLVRIGEAWIAGRLDPLLPVWIDQERGKTFWTKDRPANPFAKVIRQSVLEHLPVELEPEEPTVVVEWPSGRHALYLPESHRDNAPYVGRQHQTNVNDCYTLVRDWFKREKGVELPQVNVRQSDLYSGGTGDLMDTHPGLADWERVINGQPGDGIYFTFGDRVHPNHCGVLLEGGMFLHHFYGRLSCIEPLAGIYRQHLTCFMRPKNA